MALTFDCVSVAEGRQHAGFASFTGHSPDGLRRSANKVSAIWLTPPAEMCRPLGYQRNPPITSQPGWVASVKAQA